MQTVRVEGRAVAKVVVERIAMEAALMNQRVRSTGGLARKIE